MFDEQDVKRLKELGDFIRKEFGNEIPATVEKTDPETQLYYHLHLNIPYSAVRYVVLEEEIAKGQRIESFTIYAEEGSAEKSPVYQGTCVGHKKICLLQDPFAGQNLLTNDMEGKSSVLTVRVTSARGPVSLKSIKVYA